MICTLPAAETGPVTERLRLSRSTKLPDVVLNPPSVAIWLPCCPSVPSVSVGSATLAADPAKILATTAPDGSVIPPEALIVTVLPARIAGVAVVPIARLPFAPCTFSVSA